MNFQSGKLVCAISIQSICDLLGARMSHGTAAMLVGGRIGYLQIFHDGSVFATTTSRMSLGEKPLYLLQGTAELPFFGVVSYWSFAERHLGHQ
jgi:hypothetical protein